MLADSFNFKLYLLCLLNRLVVEVCLHSVWVPRTNSVRRRLVRPVLFSNQMDKKGLCGPSIQVNWSQGRVHLNLSSRYIKLRTFISVQVSADWCHSNRLRWRRSASVQGGWDGRSRPAGVLAGRSGGQSSQPGRQLCRLEPKGGGPPGLLQRWRRYRHLEVPRGRVNTGLASRWTETVSSHTGELCGAEVTTRSSFSTVTAYLIARQDSA